MSDAPQGLLASLRRLLATGLEIAQVRLELLVVELEQEKQRILDTLLLAAVALLMLGVAMVLLVGLVLLLFWDGYRLAALGVLFGLFLGGGLLLAWLARSRLRSPGGLAGGSLGELARDRAALEGRE